MDTSWNVIQSILSDPLSHPQTDSYRGCIENTIPRVLRQFNPIALIYKAPLESGEETDVKVDIFVGSVMQDDTIVDNGEGIFFANPTVFREGNDGATKVSPMFPNEARLRNFTYETELTVNVHIRIHDASGEFNQIIRFDTDATRISIGRLPIMVRSILCSLNTISDDPKITGECIQDQGGYYIIDGNEKVVIGQERQVENRPYTRKYREAENLIVSCECRSVPETKFQPPRTTSVRMFRKDSSIRIIAPGMQESIPFVLFMRALGIATESRMFDMVATHINPSLHEELLDCIRPSFLASRNYKDDSMEMTLLRVWSLIHGQTLEDSDTELSRARSNDVATVIKENILPHLGYDMTPKAHFIGSMIADMFLLHSNLEKPTDKDSYSNKRIDMGGFLLGKLFRDLYFRVQKKIQEKMNIHVNASEIPKDAILGIRDAFLQKEMVDRTIMDEGFRYAFKSCWGMKNAPCVVGVAQELSRYSYPAYVSHIRRINTPLPASAKMRAPHALHPSTWGYTCPVETPDGRNVGVRKNFSVAARITVGLATPPIEALCAEIGMIPLGRALLGIHSGSSIGTPIMINERVVGYIWNAVEFVKTFRALRRRGVIHPYISISFRNSLIKKTVIISTDDGRPIRPLYVIDPDTNQMVADIPQARNTIAFLCTGRADISDKEFFSIERIVDTERLSQWKERKDAFMESEKGGIMEYIDPQEQDNCLIAMSEEDLTMKDHVVRRFSHAEIHPSLIMGILGLNIPFTQTNQAPRNVYSSAQGKQAVGMYATNFNNRMDNKVMVLAYPQKPIVTTHYAPYIRNESMPHGINAVVAIMSYSGYNQEDAVIINQGAVQRGLFNSVTFRSLGTQEDIGDQETIGIIPETDIISPKKARRDLLDSRGIVKVGSIIDEDDVLVMKTAPSKYRDPQRRVMLRSDLSLQTKRHESGVVDSVFVDSDRQDGTLVKIRLRKPKTPELGDKFSSRHGQKGTIGMLLPEADMPVNSDGIRPDILVNPHAIPSRMTIGQLVEVILGKRGSLRGEQYAATAFENGDPRTVADLLQGMGMESYGNEVLYNGRSGEQLRVNIFMGPTFYQRLMHQVADKVNVRTTGPKSAITRQPVGGRGAGGGLRIGEMERDALISHGVASFLKESLMERSDKSSVWIGTKSGMISACNPEKGLYQDFLTEDFSRVRARNEEGELTRGDERIVLSNPRSEFCRLEIPHALKLLIQELEAQGYKIGVITDFILKMWEKVSPETVREYQKLVDQSATSVGAKTSKKMKDVSWVEPLVRWGTAKFGKSLTIGLSAEFVEAIRDIQKKLQEISTVTNQVELRRLDESAASVANGELGAIVVSPDTKLESVLDPMSVKADSVLISTDAFLPSQEATLRRLGWIPMPSYVFQLRDWQCWQKRYRNPPKPMRLLTEQTGLFTTKMEPLYPSILSSEPVAGSVFELARRAMQLGHTSSLISTEGIKQITRGYVVSTHASSAPIPFSKEEGGDLYRDEFTAEQAKLAIIETKRARRGALPIFHTYTRPGYLEVTDESRNLIRWVFPMSRLHVSEVQAMATLVDTYAHADTGGGGGDQSFVVLPEKTVPIEGLREQAVIGTRIPSGSKTTSHGCCLPPVDVINRRTSVQAPSVTAEKDPKTTNALVFAGSYPDHLTQSDILNMRGILWYWTKVTDVARCKEEPEFDVILPSYVMGSFTEPSELPTLFDSMALCELVCEPESLYASLHHNVPVVFCSPYDGWLQVGSFAPSYATWNPAESKLEMPDADSGSPVYVRVPDGMTPDQWETFVEWIRESSDVLQDIQGTAHAWLAANSRETLIQSCVKDVWNHVRALDRGETTNWDTIMKQEQSDISFELEIPEEDKEGIGSLLGARGTVANRSRYVTGLQHSISKESNRIVVKGTASNTMTEAGLKTLYAGYLSFSDKSYDVAPILDIEPDVVRKMDMRTILMQLSRKEASLGLIPLKIGAGINRRLRMNTLQLRLRGQRRDLELYTHTMQIHEPTTVSEEDMVQIGELSGRKHFVVVVPEYTFDLMDHQGDEEFMESLVERQVAYIHERLQRAKEIIGASAEFRVVSLSSHYWSPESYPIKDSKQRIAISDDESIQVWNVGAMESFLLKDGVKHADWFVNITGDAEYMVWMPPYWKPNPEKDEDELQVFLSMFIEPVHERGKIYLWDPSKVNEEVRSVPWMCSLRAPESSVETTALEDEGDWSDVLEEVWDEENWEAMATTMDTSKPSDRILKPSLPNIQEAYVSSLEKKEDVIHVQLAMRPELLESELWTIEEGKQGVEHWVDLLESYTVLTKDDIEVTPSESGENIVLQIKNVESRYVTLIVAVLLQSVKNAGGQPWQVKNVTEGGLVYELEKGSTPMTWDTMDAVRLPNGMDLPEYAVANVVDKLHAIVSDVTLDDGSNSITVKQIDTNETVIMECHDSEAAVYTDVDLFSDIIIKDGMVPLYAALRRMAHTQSPPGTPPMAPQSPPGTPPVAPQSPPGTPPGELAEDDLATQTLRTEGGLTMAQRLALESDDI